MIEEREGEVEVVDRYKQVWRICKVDDGALVRRTRELAGKREVLSFHLSTEAAQALFLLFTRHS